jgi:iron complex outermembrane receptor protein
MNLRTRAWIATLSATASSFALISAAQAQQTSPTGEDANVLTEIVVTAQRRAESLQDVPMSVDVATGEQIERLNIFDAKDVQQLSPGLQLQNNDGRSNTATLRGISFNPDQGTSPAVDLYLNEAPVDAQTAFTAIYDIEQIEVLRGPQGALRGRTSPAGAITFRTRRANLDEFEGYVQGTYSDAAAWNVQGGVSIPIVPGKFAMRVAALTDGNRGNQVYNIPQGEYSRSRTESARLTSPINI